MSSAGWGSTAPGRTCSGDGPKEMETDTHSEAVVQPQELTTSYSIRSDYNIDLIAKRVEKAFAEARWENLRREQRDKDAQAEAGYWGSSWAGADNARRVNEDNNEKNPLRFGRKNENEVRDVQPAFLKNNNKVEKSSKTNSNSTITRTFEEDLRDEDCSSVCSGELERFIDLCEPYLVEKKTGEQQSEEERELLNGKANKHKLDDENFQIQPYSEMTVNTTDVGLTNCVYSLDRIDLWKVRVAKEEWKQ